MCSLLPEWNSRNFMESGPAVWKAAMSPFSARNHNSLCPGNSSKFRIRSQSWSLAEIKIGYDNQETNGSDKHSFTQSMTQGHLVENEEGSQQILGLGRSPPLEDVSVLILCGQLCFECISGCTYTPKPSGAKAGLIEHIPGFLPWSQLKTAIKEPPFLNYGCVSAGVENGPGREDKAHGAGCNSTGIWRAFILKKTFNSGMWITQGK